MCHYIGKNLKFLILTTSGRRKERMDVERTVGCGGVGGNRRDEGR